ncbi:hypothetical protein R4172_02485 [Rhodococcus kroppenstedtii]|uniref:hypothetical protein n=1 Tax=Rhodococcoides kroppenstedtii TaxID=293050 RepID=UPI00295456A9|nr:hypothetical protein [Rhodococcus kroppenstedtii]MDV7196429.1 hypothetical protein [Rhodococcus kroppenstedtii]
MAVTLDDGAGADPILDRAARELRDEETPSWVTVSAAILETLRRTTRRTTPIDAAFPSEAAGDTLRIGDHVVRLAVLRALGGLPSRVRAVKLDVDGRRLIGASLDIAIPYLQDLDDLVVAIETRVVDALAEVVGVRVSPSNVRIHVVDVVAP